MTSNVEVNQWYCMYGTKGQFMVTLTIQAVNVVLGSQDTFTDGITSKSA